MKTAIVWKESIFKNGYKCNVCGEVLFKDGGFTNMAGVDAHNIDDGNIYCINCGNHVAVLRECGDDEVGGSRWNHALQ